MAAFAAGAVLCALPLRAGEPDGVDWRSSTDYDVFRAMQGRYAGLTVLAPSGAPGVETAAVLRGYSLNGESPLIIVDGLRVDNLANIDPSTVESVELLRDASASVLYGAEAAEGAITGSADLAGKTIGVQLGTTGDQLATEYEQNEGSTVERYNKGADAIQALKQGKIDCVIIDGNPAKAFVEKNEDLKILDEELSSEEYAMCVNKDNTELTEAINGALAQLKEDGTLDSIIANYIGDEAGQHPYTSPEGVDRSKGTLVMATNAYFEPYEYYDGDKIVGIDADMAQAVCDVLGYELVIEDMEFDAIINAIQSGKADIGVAGMTVTEDRLQSVDFTDTYATARQVIIVKE